MLARTVLTIAAGLLLAADDSPQVAWTKADLGKVPTGWKSLSTGEKAATKWDLQADDEKKTSP